MDAALTPPSVVNPKDRDATAKNKVPLQLIPPISEHNLALALKFGADKYGPWNWRTERIALSTYIGALKRHTAALARGEWFDIDSGLPHAAHIEANAAILQDAKANGMLVDDTPATPLTPTPPASTNG